MADTPYGWVEPNYQDDVKNLNNEYAGRVIAKYEIDGVVYFDVRCDDRIFYKTLATSWATVTTEEERPD
jgi:hypothetical protein